MFVGDQLLVRVGFEVARERFQSFLAEGWLDDVSGKAHADGLIGLTRVGPFGAVLGASKLVRVHLLPPVPRDGAVLLGVRWEATGVMGRLFPVLDADLALTPTEADATLLTLVGTYRPPLAGLGSGLDRLILNRAAIATVRSLLARIAAALDPADEPAPERVARLAATAQWNGSSEPSAPHDSATARKLP